MQKLKILVLHGQVQTASTVAHNTRPLREALSDIADVFYAEGPAVEGNEMGSRPWWVWQGDRGTDRWNDTVCCRLFRILQISKWMGRCAGGTNICWNTRTTV